MILSFQAAFRRVDEDVASSAELRWRSDHLAERAGRLVVPTTGSALSDDDIRALRDADRR
jgi:hypothetical protein